MISKPTVSRLLILLVLASLLLVACGGTPSPTASVSSTKGAEPNQPEATQVGAYPAAVEPTVNEGVSPEAGYPAPGGASLQIVKPDGSSVTLDASMLQNVNLQDVTSGGQTVSGYPLSAILLVAGVSDYSQLVVTGASNSVTLSKDQVGQDVVIVLPPSGGPQLAGNVPNGQVVNDITSIEAK